MLGIFLVDIQVVLLTCEVPSRTEWWQRRSPGARSGDTRIPCLHLWSCVIYARTDVNNRRSCWIVHIQLVGVKKDLNTLFTKVDDWIVVSFNLDTQDLRYIERVEYPGNGQILSPILQELGRIWVLYGRQIQMPSWIVDGGTRMHSTERDVITHLKSYMALVALEVSKVCRRKVAIFDDTRKEIGIFRINREKKALKDDLSTTVDQTEDEESNRNTTLGDSSVLRYLWI